MKILTHRTRAALLVLPVLLAASAACDIAMSEQREKETAEWRKSYQMQPGGRLEIGNVNGKIDVRRGEGNTVEVAATKIAHGPSKESAKEALDRITITEEASASLVKIQTKLQRGDGGMFSGGNLQVQYTVTVPAQLEVHVTTINGGVEVSGLEGRVVAEATNGGVRGRDLAGSVEASTTNGGVEIDLAQVSEAGVKLETTNGGIKLRLPADAKASITARIVNGGIDTEGLSIQSSGEASKRRLDGNLNGGGPRIQLEGTNGGIQIRAR
jgi:hypothetical protein